MRSLARLCSLRIQARNREAHIRIRVPVQDVHIQACMHIYVGKLCMRYVSLARPCTISTFAY